MSGVVGISFGNTSAFVSVLGDEGGRVEVVANHCGERSTSTVVAYQEGEILTGGPALSLATRQPSNSVKNLKSLIGTEKLDGSAAGAGQACKLAQPKQDSEIVVNFNNNSRKGVSALAKHVFTGLVETAASALGEGKFDVVISVPLSASQTYKNTISSVASAAGFTVLDLIPEPIAVLLHADQSTPSPDGHTVVLRIGGFSMSVAVVKCTGGIYSVVASSEENYGGALFDRALATFVCQEFNRKHKCKVEENPRSWSKVLRASRDTKHVLTKCNTAECSIESLYEGYDLVTNISRPRFETLMQDGLVKIKGVIEKVISGVTAPIDRVVLAGGTCHVPKLQTLISSMFSNSTIFNQSPDEILSMGATQHASTVSQYRDLSQVDVEQNGTVQVPVTSCSIGVRVGDYDASLTPIVPQNTPLPHKTEVELPVEGSLFALEADGKVILRASCEEKSKVGIQLEIGEDSSVEGIIKDLGTNERTSFSIPAPVATNGS